MKDHRYPGMQSPCENICVIEPDSGYCIGCGRTREEIAGWIAMSPEMRSSVMDTLSDRLATLTLNKRRKGGHRARKRSLPVDPD
jgi:predicted Fe-S protein YdhL (DUF1289 family)